MEILFNNNGTPLMLNSTVFFGDSINDGVISGGLKKRDILAPFDVSYMNRETVGDYQVLRWGGTTCSLFGLMKSSPLRRC